MIPVLSREQMRDFDRHAIEVCRVPSLVLMENAGRNAASVILRALDGSRSKIVVVAGPGNNGGDGFVVARRLLTAGHTAELFLVADPQQLGGDARANHDAWRGLGGRVTSAMDDAGVMALAAALASLDPTDVVVDALLGTGLDRDVEGNLARVIEAILDCDARTFSLDLPSGLDANTGAVLGVAVCAEATITFAHLKTGLLTPSGAEHAGDVHVVDIGVPGELVREVGCSALLFDDDDARELWVPRGVAAHKGTAGHVFAVAGSPGKSGAALLVARGALRAGAGLVTICAFPEAADALDARVLEEMTTRIDPDAIEASLDQALSRANVVVVGPGLGLSDRARRVAEHVVSTWDGIKVVDADALSAFEGRGAELARARGRLILTPHPAELGRLLGTNAAEVERDRYTAVARAAELTGAVVLLKGARTLVAAPGETTLVTAAGTPALATAGAGDVLAGVIAAFANHLAPRFAAILGAHVHARAAEAWAESTGADRGLIAREVADGIPDALARLAQATP
jgi:NAD(P)H-hydrate epimerase